VIPNGTVIREAIRQGDADACSPSDLLIRLCDLFLTKQLQEW
jgi:hypothetical protein